MSASAVAPSGETTERFIFACDLARRAGERGLAHFRDRGGLDVSSKGAQDVVTNADREIEEMIRSEIARAFPGDLFFGEETGADAFDAGSRVWVVDPIHGTQPFVSGLSEWCVSIAYVDRMELEFGCVFAPARDELFAGGRGFPATLNGAPISGHGGASLGDGITAVGHSPRVPVERFLPVIEGVLRQGGMFYRSGSGALSLCDVACGRLLAYVEVHINSWDCLGAVAVLRAAGLRTTNMTASVEALLEGAPIAVANAPDIYARLVKLVAPEQGAA